MITLFGKTKILEGEVSSYLAILQKSALIFNEAIQEYMVGEFKDYEKRVVDIIELEHEADTLKKTIKHKLYRYMLIPEARGDVWQLLEELDHVLDVTKKIMENFSFEQPDIPESIKKHFLKIADYSQKAVDELVKATNSYFTNFTLVNEYTNKVLFFEHEVDKIEDLIKKTVFASDEVETLSHRIQLRYFAEKMALVSDQAERVCEKLSIFVMKREL
ncbi:MAG: DUF47 family protein [Proteobacteria bacterium]|nr:DUF47 family protein [Pseudomonadota bacterium]